jgi:hypothetical protein
MSALGPKADIGLARVKADIVQHGANVRFVPKAEIRWRRTISFSPLRFRPLRMCSGTVARAGIGNTPDRTARVISDQ